MEYWIKLGISHAEFDLVMAEEPRLYSDILSKEGSTDKRVLRFVLI